MERLISGLWWAVVLGVGAFVGIMLFSQNPDQAIRTAIGTFICAFFLGLFLEVPGFKRGKDSVKRVIDWNFVTKWSVGFSIFLFGFMSMTARDTGLRAYYLGAINNQQISWTAVEQKIIPQVFVGGIVSFILLILTFAILTLWAYFIRGKKDKSTDQVQKEIKLGLDILFGFSAVVGLMFLYYALVENRGYMFAVEAISVVALAYLVRSKAILSACYVLLVAFLYLLVKYSIAIEGNRLLVLSLNSAAVYTWIISCSLWKTPLLFGTQKNVRTIGSNASDTTNKVIDDKFYKIAFDEITINRVEPTLWAKAFALAEGDSEKARALYIKYRAQQLNGMVNSQLPVDSEPSVQENNQPLLHAIWNPSAAANWSLLFTPAFGSYLHMLNWRTLDEPEKEASAQGWFYASIIMLVFYIVLEMLVTDAKLSNGYTKGLTFIFLIVWYFTVGYRQGKYVREKFGTNYSKKTWGQPLSIGVAVSIAYIAVAIGAGYLYASWQLQTAPSSVVETRAQPSTTTDQSQSSTPTQSKTTSETTSPEVAQTPEQIPADLPVGTRMWLDKNQWFIVGSNPQASALARQLDAALQKEGFKPDDPEMYIELNRRLKAAMPNLVVGDIEIPKKTLTLLEQLLQRANTEIASTEDYYLLGIIYQNGKDGPKNEAEAIQWYRRAADQGHPIAQYNLGMMFFEGLGVEKNDFEAFKWIKKSAEQGAAIPQNALGSMYLSGLGVLKNEVEAAKWYRLAADQGYAPAQNNLGIIYNDGRGVSKNYVEAINWFRKSAEQGYAEAQLRISIMYAEGQGTKKDDSLAFQWCRRSADQGFARAQNNLGLMYANGQGVLQNYGEAINWFLKSANQGFVAAQYNMGYFYTEGLGVLKDYEQAINWYTLAAKQGNVEAQKALKEFSFIGTTEDGTKIIRKTQSFDVPKINQDNKPKEKIPPCVRKPVMSDDDYRACGIKVPIAR